MKKSLFFAASIAMLLGFICTSQAVATVFDITTFSADTEQGRVARFVGGGIAPYGFTTVYPYQYDPYNGTEYISTGLYDHVSYHASWCAANWMSDGNVNSLTSTWGDAASEDFAGYMFRRAATVQQVNFVNGALYNGGTFDGAPIVEVLVGGTLKSGLGTWQTAAVTWDTPYNSDFGFDGIAPDPYPNSTENRSYTITLDTPASVWGVRLRGPALDGWFNSESVWIQPSDPTGFISIQELAVVADVTITNQIDLSTNLALGQTAIFAADLFSGHGGGDPTLLTDGNYGSGNFVSTVYSPVPLDGREFMGVMFDTPQSNVAAIGAAIKSWNVGGDYLPETMLVEYTTDGGTTWVAATGLDLGRYEEDYAELTQIPQSQIHTELFTFDTITAAINGIRLSGVQRTSEAYPDGFTAATEFEVFAAIVDDWIPGDANKDGFVDGSDATILANYWQYGVGATNPDATWAMGDFNGDHVVDGSDATLLASHWQEGTPPPSAVPEPSTLLMLFGALGLWFVMRKKSR